jgi:NAD(P)-dependent dehydrogenase (short-subunit alcohol dehydrogenase family)
LKREQGDLAGKVALVVGGSRGIGAEAARAIAAAGASVAIGARDQGALDAVVLAITQSGGRAVASPTDVSSPEAIARLVDRTVTEFGGLDLALNNAAGGGHPPTPLADVAVNDYDSAIGITLRGIFLGMKYEIPALLARGGGAIVNMASTAGLEAVAGMAGYVAAKHGVIGLTRVAALDYAGTGIRVNAIAPGPILTDRLEAAGLDAQRRAGLALPLGRVGKPGEVAAAVVWLMSDKASFVTGATLAVDGGMLAGTPPFSPRQGS